MHPPDSVLRKEQILQTIQQQLTRGMEAADGASKTLHALPEISADSPGLEAGIIALGNGSVPGISEQTGDFHSDTIASHGIGVQDIIGLISVDSGQVQTGTAASTTDTKTDSMDHPGTGAATSHIYTSTGHTDHHQSGLHTSEATGGRSTIDTAQTGMKKHDIIHPPASTLHPQSEMAKVVEAARARLAQTAAKVTETASSAHDHRLDGMLSNLDIIARKPDHQTGSLDAGIATVDSALPSTSMTKQSSDLSATSPGDIRGASLEPISVDMQHFKHVDMSDIFTKLNMIADKTQAQVQSASVDAETVLAGQADKKAQNVNDNIKQSLGNVFQDQSHKGNAILNAVNAYPLEPVTSSKGKLQGEVVSKGNVIDVALQKDATLNQNIDPFVKPDEAFKGKVIKAQDGLTEKAVENGFTRTAASDISKIPSLNDISLLSSGRLLGNIKETQSKAMPYIPDIGSLPVEATLGENTQAAVSETAGANRVTSGIYAASGSDKMLGSAVDKAPLEVTNSGPLPIVDGINELKHHKNETQAEKTIQHVTTKNTTLPDGSTVIETKTKTIEMKVKESTKITAGLKDVSKSPQIEQAVSKSELTLAPADTITDAKNKVMQNTLLENKQISERLVPAGPGRLQSGFHVKSDTLSLAQDEYRPDAALAAETSSSLDKASSGFDAVIQSAIKDIVQESKSSKSKPISNGAQEPVASVDSLAADTHITDSTPDLSVLGEGLSQIAKMTQESGPTQHVVKSKSGKADVNITSKKAKVNIKKDNTKRTVSEFDVSPTTQQNAQHDVAFIILGGEGRGPEITLKGLAQKLDQINQRDMSRSGQETAQPISEQGTAIPVDSSLAVDKQSQSKPTVSPEAVKSIHRAGLAPDITSIPSGLPEQIDFRDVLPVARPRTTVDQLTRERVSLSEPMPQTRIRQGATEGLHSRRRTFMRSRTRGTMSDAMSGLPGSDTQRRRPTSEAISDSSVSSRQRARSFIDASAMRSRPRNTGFSDRRTLRADTRLPPFPSGLTGGIRSGPDSGILTPDLRAEFERRRLEMHRVASVGRRRAGGSGTMQRSGSMPVGSDILSLRRRDGLLRGTSMLPSGRLSISGSDSMGRMSTGERIAIRPLGESLGLPAYMSDPRRPADGRTFMAGGRDTGVRGTGRDFMLYEPGFADGRYTPGPVFRGREQDSGGGFGAVRRSSISMTRDIPSRTGTTRATRITGARSFDTRGRPSSGPLRSAATERVSGTRRMGHMVSSRAGTSSIGRSSGGSLRRSDRVVSEGRGTLTAVARSGPRDSPRDNVITTGNRRERVRGTLGTPGDRRDSFLGTVSSPGGRRDSIRGTVSSSGGQQDIFIATGSSPGGRRDSVRGTVGTSGGRRDSVGGTVGTPGGRRDSGRGTVGLSGGRQDSGRRAVGTFGGRRDIDRGTVGISGGRRDSVRGTVATSGGRRDRGTVSTSSGRRDSLRGTVSTSGGTGRMFEPSDPRRERLIRFSPRGTARVPPTGLPSPAAAYGPGGPYFLPGGGRGFSIPPSLFPRMPGPGYSGFPDSIYPGLGLGSGDFMGPSAGFPYSPFSPLGPIL